MKAPGCCTKDSTFVYGSMALNDQVQRRPVFMLLTKNYAQYALFSHIIIKNKFTLCYQVHFTVFVLAES